MILDLLLQSGISVRRVASTHGGEWAGPCPWCGGRDRFRVWPERDRFWCRVCEKKGDSIQLLRDLEGLSLREACERVGREPEGRPDGYHPKSAPITIPESAPPSPAWQETGRRFVAESQGKLWSGTGAKALSWLKGRGLTEETIREAGLGYNPVERRDPPGTWGLPKDHKPVWLPRGVVIPWEIGGKLWKVNIRRPAGDPRYIGPAGCGVALYRADALLPGRTAVLLEGELDALSVAQEAGDLVAAVATGSTAGARRVRWIARLSMADPVLVSFDADPSGDLTATWWLERLGPSARRWRPWWDDPAAMLKEGVDLRSWVLAGLLGESWEAFGERAAILEYEANLPRQEAERLALAELRALDRWVHDRIRDLEELEAIQAAGGFAAVIDSWESLETVLRELNIDTARVMSEKGGERHEVPG